MSDKENRLKSESGENERDLSQSVVKEWVV